MFVGISQEKGKVKSPIIFINKQDMIIINIGTKPKDCHEE
jgi:glutaredoxin